MLACSAGDLLVAIGGGVVGDLGGFAAATVLRGIGLLQVPTTLLSMVDSSVGGKTAINHHAGKNLIGAFHQAKAVLIDSAMLATLPDRECRSGWAEIIKHAVIESSTPGGQPPVLLDVLERNHEALKSLEEPLLSWVIGRNVAIKAAVVAADEREAGIRAFLNFGHTIGHGIEAAGYSLLHGEAVAVGMSAALEIAAQMNLVDSSYVARIRHLIATFGLPLSAAVDPVVVLEKMSVDKKKSQGQQTWVLPCRGGGVELRTDVPHDVVWQAITSVARHE
jgi:3-dehydroquinate synthetase